MLQLKKLQRRLAEPYSFTGSFLDSIWTFLLISGFVTLFVFIFRSDVYTNSGSWWECISVSFYFGLATFVGVSFNTILIMRMVTQKTERSWTVRHEIILYIAHILVISIFNFLLSAFILNYSVDFSVGSFLSSIVSTVIVGAIPISIYVLQQQKKQYKANYDLARKLNFKLTQEESNQQENVVNLKEVKVPIEDILYIESNKNYVHISLSETKPEIVRMTLKETEKRLEPFVQIVRCHRAFIVNLEKVNKVEGNAQGLRLFLNETSNYIPVSRSYIPKVEKLVKSI